MDVNYSDERVRANIALYDVHSPILCSKIGEEDKIIERSVKSIKDKQINLFEMI